MGGVDGPTTVPRVFNLAVNVQEIGGGSQGTNFTPEPSKPLAWSTEQGCSPAGSMWTVLFGVLADPQDRAYAYTTHGRYLLRTATIPSRFKATGVAAYSSSQNSRSGYSSLPHGAPLW